MPPAYQTWYSRVSPESGDDSTSSWLGSLVSRNCQQPGPNGVASAVSLMHCPSGKSPAFWLESGGNTYVSPASAFESRFSFGFFASAFSDEVFVIAQRTTVFAVPVGLPVSEPSPATVLSRYSVPPASVA